MKMTRSLPAITLILLGVSACTPRKAPQTSTADVAAAAQRTYVAPGQLDEMYLFYSGGQSGNVYVAGVPSMRHISTIPVFAKYPGTGYGFDEDSRKMLGGYDWGDVHHPALSQTNGQYDGRWLFVNDNANNRVARIDLRDFRTKQIIGPIPNASGTHGSSFVTSNTDYVFLGSRFSIPLPKGTVQPIEQYATKYHGILSGLKVDSATGTMSIGWQILTPPFNWDLSSTGKGPSEGWVFFSSYNSERATGRLEVTASQHDRDYAAFVNWRAAAQAAQEGKGEMLGGVRVLDPAKVPGVMYLVPLGKSPHGMDVAPDGRYIVGGGKLAPVVTVFDFTKFQQAVAAKDFSGAEDGIPVVKYESVRVAEVPVGIGPLHTQFDDQGFAYTSLFIESAVAKWKLGPFDGHDSTLIVDKIPVSFSIGHLAIPGSDTRHPYGKYLVAMNKLSHDRHLSVGPSQPETSQLIDITGQKMVMLYEAFTEPEPHFAQMVLASVLHPIEVYPKEENHDKDAIWRAQDASVTRSGTTVTAKVFAIRTYFAPSTIEANQGDSVIIHITNAEQTRDETHGFGLGEYNINVTIDPGETKTIAFRANKPGVWPYYCTNFCSAMHQEMQGYLLVRPRGGPAASDK
jgi:nitrous-oxide reductase